MIIDIIFVALMVLAVFKGLRNGLVVRRAVPGMRLLFGRELEKDGSRMAPLAFEHLGCFVDGKQPAAIGAEDVHEGRPVLGVRRPVVDVQLRYQVDGHARHPSVCDGDLKGERSTPGE